MPVTWSESRNLKWKAPLPGPGSSSPIIWGQHIYVTCYSGYGAGRDAAGRMEDLKRHLVCVSAKDGSITWDTTVPAEMPEDAYRGYLREHGYASSTPVSDGERVYVFFGKTGVLTPFAMLEPVEIAGTTVSHTVNPEIKLGLDHPHFPSTRAGRLRSSAVRQWTTAQVELHVRR